MLSLIIELPSILDVEDIFAYIVIKEPAIAIRGGSNGFEGFAAIGFGAREAIKAIVLAA